MKAETRGFGDRVLCLNWGCAFRSIFGRYLVERFKMRDTNVCMRIMLWFCRRESCGTKSQIAYEKTKKCLSADFV